MNNAQLLFKGFAHEMRLEGAHVYGHLQTLLHVLPYLKSLLQLAGIRDNFAGNNMIR